MSGRIAEPLGLEGSQGERAPLMRFLRNSPHNGAWARAAVKFLDDWMATPGPVRLLRNVPDIALILIAVELE